MCPSIVLPPEPVRAGANVKKFLGERRLDVIDAPVSLDALSQRSCQSPKSGRFPAGKRGQARLDRVTRRADAPDRALQFFKHFDCLSHSLFIEGCFQGFDSPGYVIDTHF